MSGLTRVIWRREAAAYLRSPSAYTGQVAFLALAAGLFFTALQLGEGTFWSLPALWTVAVAIPLPLLTILLTMPLLAGERSSGTLQQIMILPIPMRRVVAGKFLAAYGAALLGLLGALVPWAFLSHNLAGRLPPMTALLPSMAVLALHAMSWTALGLLASAMAHRSWAAAVGTLLMGGGLMLAWASLSKLVFGGHLQPSTFPVIAELLDAAAGRISLHTAVMHVSFASWCLFMSLQVLEGRR